MAKRKNRKSPLKLSGSSKHQTKLSEDILDFAGHLWDPPNLDDLPEESVVLAIMLWNLFTLSEQQQEELLAHLRMKLGALGNPAVEADLQRMLKVRRTVYGHDRRAVVNFNFNDEGDATSFQVASIDTSSMEDVAAQIQSTPVSELMKPR